MKNELLQILPPYYAQEKVIIKNQGINDIINGILETHEKYKSQYDKIAHKFDSKDNRAIARKLWNFLKKNVPYRIEPESKQTLRSPSAIISNLSGADCKSFALWIGGNLSALQRMGKKINWVYRFSSYKFFDPEPQHVFVVMNPGSDNEIWIDPVLPEFDFKKQYYYHKDKKPMALVSVSGVPLPKKAKKTVLKKAAEIAKKGGKVVLKVAATPSRNAFLLLVKLNVFGLANKLKAAIAKNADSVNRFWSSAGGNTNNLLTAVRQGSTKKRILGEVAIGEPAVAASIAAATPLIVKVAELLKKLGIDPAELKKVAIDKAKQLANDELDKLAAKGEKIETIEEENLNQMEKEAGIKDSSVIKKSNPMQFDFKKYLPIILVAGAGIYFISKKK